MCPEHKNKLIEWKVGGSWHLARTALLTKIMTIKCRGRIIRAVLRKLQRYHYCGRNPIVRLKYRQEWCCICMCILDHSSENVFPLKPRQIEITTCPTAFTQVNQYNQKVQIFVFNQATSIFLNYSRGSEGYIQGM